MWPPRSPNLSPEFFLWDYIKGVKELSTNIEAAVPNITFPTLRKISANVVERVRVCVRGHGAHFEHVVTMKY
jgi:hypothetical protein